jgi:two-component system CheB/CheR fusion protein
MTRLDFKIDVIVNDRGDIVYIHGRTGYYLEPASGQARMNVLDMAREGLQLELATALRQAVTKNVEILHPNVRVKANGDYVTIDLAVERIAEPEPIRGLAMISFRPEALHETGQKAGASHRQ